MRAMNTVIQKFMPELASIESRRSMLVADGLVPHGTEVDLVRLFQELFATGNFEGRIPMAEGDTLVIEQAFRYGRADIVIYHQDGSVSVIEAKNGSVGYTHAVSGIGQATLYAVQIVSKGVAKRVRRCLLWSSTGDQVLDALIDLACESAGVVSLSMPSMGVLMSTRAAVRSLYAEATSGR